MLQSSNKRLERLSLLLNKLTLAMNLIGSMLIVALTVLVNADVIGRNLFDTPLSGVPEIVSLSIVAIVFLQIAYTAQQGKLTRSDALLTRLGVRFPKFQLFIEALFNLVAAFIIASLYLASYPFFIKAWDRDSFVGSIGDFTAPIWPIKLVILAGCLMLFLQFLMSAALRCYQLSIQLKEETS